jgi:hypothetical protein
MNTEELQAIRSRCDAATPGPWIAKAYNPYRDRAVIHQTPESQKINPLRWQRACICREVRAHDADFIEHARTDIPALLAEVERLRDIEARAQAQSEDVQANWLSPIEAAALQAEVARLRAALEEAKTYMTDSALQRFVCHTEMIDGWTP